ncbi:hypothetical protein KRZ98_16930 [Sphingobium sp. AS12]|uniref:hypothetical protein n=1 Tax=Sphingobium sp. AS12 TaxID=2849495 RepID=UPI001C31C3AB|nr:hypothetical protein [Sphingobium sp. AS12]MBV2149931.1 hypothetical protein [Sphingobium sp. AS12]
MRPRHVHIYATVCVQIAVDAEDHRDAMKKADGVLFENGFAVRLIPNSDAVMGADYAKEVIGYLVDEADDPEFSHWCSYDANHKAEGRTTHFSLMQERDRLSAIVEAACHARDGAGIVGVSPAEAITMLDEDNKRLLDENARSRTPAT